MRANKHKNNSNTNKYAVTYTAQPPDSEEPVYTSRRIGLACLAIGIIATLYSWYLADRIMTGNISLISYFAGPFFLVLGLYTIVFPQRKGDKVVLYIGIILGVINFWYSYPKYTHPSLMPLFYFVITFSIIFYGTFLLYRFIVSKLKRLKK